MTEPNEEVRWYWQVLGFETPEQFEERRGEPWVSENSRAHESCAVPSSLEGNGRGIRRQVRDGDEFVFIKDEHHGLLDDLLVGRTIVAVEREPSSGEDWQHGENTVRITLDNGARLEFMGTGYDASALITSYAPPPSGTEGTT
jgi:hypothetical protein